MKKHYSARQMILIVFAIIVLMASWESNRSTMALADSDIPQDSIRLRILANSDTIADQAMKRVVRDAVIAQMNTWVKEPDGIEAARRIVTAEIPALQALVGHELLEHGYNYTYKVELGIVPFPTKMYGNRVYPAGNYEALRITLGSGLGQNWWCVLFPPLCFMDAISGEAVAKDEPTTDVQLGKAANLQSKDNSDSSNYTQASPDLTHASIQIHSKAQIHFFVWDKSKLLYSWVKHKL